MAHDNWRDSLRPKIAQAREAQAGVPLAELARRGGGSVEGEALVLPFFGAPYRVTWPELRVLAPDGEECPEELTALLLDYLLFGDGTAPCGRGIGFRELPHGGFYFRAFQGYTGDILVRELDLVAFRRAAETLGGEPVELGDAAYRFFALPKLSLAVVWWEGDEEFPPKAAVLFDATAGGYLPAEGLAILGRILCRRLIRARGD
ncbi:DUF3786 domain-containing protein [Candidatus Bipolaricaulota bacterium]|nr:DUF3786 domain-containing protein [Candidatus Bipolaricaulota bacterium]